MAMELKSSSPMSAGLSPPDDCVSDPEEKEISDDDDDDRNHKHRRRDLRSQSSDPFEQGLSQPYRKRNRPFENGQSDPHSDYDLDRGFSKFEKRRTVRGNFSRFSGEHGFGRGRGRGYQRDSRFGNVDVALQLAHTGSIPSAMFSGRGLPSVSNVPAASWNSFGLIPANPNGGIDAINPLGMPILRPQLNPSLNMGIQRQRCRDFEERGFCLRGDMCLMEHGVNRIVVEDVQSLSQFNLPVSLPSAHPLGTSNGSGFGQSVGVSSNAVINNSGAHNRPSKSTVDDVALNLDGTFTGAPNVSLADVYDPDQPLWNNDSHDTSAQLFGQPAKFDESKPLMNAAFSDRFVQISGTAIALQNTSSSVWGRLNSSKNKLDLKEKYDSRSKSSEYHQSSKLKEIREASNGPQVTSYLGKQSNELTYGPKTVGSTSKLQKDVGSNAKKSMQRAHRTLFVNCIPQKDNKRENLLSHFRKFGEVIDIYIPANSERAFVQFSKREDAERALKAPDAVMASRFIKVWWANRDSIPEEGMSSGNSVLTPCDTSAASGPPHLNVPNKVKDNLQYSASRVAMLNAPASLVTAGIDSKPVIANGPKGPPPGQKKMESLELLKEELRKKQEMLEQKRNDFRRQLDKISKQATGVKTEVSDGQAMKKQKAETSTDAVKPGKSLEAVVSGSSLQAEMLVNKVLSVENSASHQSKINTAAALHDPQSLKRSVRPLASGIPFHVNRYKLDNRPTAFRICAPLPTSLANVAALRDHFKLYGEVHVEIEELNEENSPKSNACNDSEAVRKCSACISFTTRHAAERAFVDCKSWHAHNLQFIWVTSNVPSNSRSSGESSSALRGVMNSEVESAQKIAHDDSQDTVGLSARKPAHKLLNEISPDSPKSNGREHSPGAAEECSGFETQSPVKSASYIPLEMDEPENWDDTEIQEETDVGDMLALPDKGLEVEASDSLLTGEGEGLSRGNIC